MAQNKRSDDNSAVLNKGLDKMGRGVKTKSRSSSSYDFVFDSICYRITDRTLLTCEVAGCMRGYRPSTGIVVIPAFVSGKGQTWMVTSIGDRAFYQCTSIKNVALPDSVKSIGDEAFSGCSALKYIYLPSALTEMGTSAFSHCSSLESFHVPSSVKRIGDGAFTACSSLQHIGVHGAVPPKMGNQVFASCHQLDSVFVPVGAKTHYHSTPWNVCELVEVPKLAKYDEFEQNGIYYKNDGLGHCEVVSKSGYSGSVVIPATVEYYGEQYSTEIDFRSFEGSYSLEHLVFLSSFGFYSFSTPFGDCLSLKTMQLPSTLTSLNLSWFADCPSLKSIEIPASVENINNGCASLTQITLLTYTPPENADFLSKCKNLSTIYVPAGAHDAYNKAPWNQYSIVELKGPKRGSVLDIDGFQYRVTSSTTCELAGIPKKTPGTVAIPSSVKYGENHFAVTGIGVKAFFERRSLREVNLPSSISYISDNAFTWSDSLQSIRIPASVIRLGKDVFVRCRQLNHIEVDANNPVFDSRDHCNAIISTADNKLLSACNNSRIPSSVTSIGDGAFSYCDALESIQIPSSVTSIGDEAFYHCDVLKSIQIPSSVTSIGDEAFAACHSMKDVEISSSVTHIGLGAFNYCSSLKKMVVVAGNPVYDSRENCNAIIETGTHTLIASCTTTKIPLSVKTIGKKAFRGSYQKKIKIPSSVTSIGDEAFSGCDALESIQIPSSVKSIGNGAFSYCESLESIQIPSSVTSIGDGAFSSCESLTSIQIPSSVTSIGDRAFSYCESLESIQIPSSVTSIGDEAFSGCDALESIQIPSSVTNIGDEAFHFCESLESIQIPSSVTSIGNRAFYGCDALESIQIPSSVKSIGKWAFSSCEKLTTMKWQSSTPPALGFDVLWFCNMKLKIYVPRGSKQAYQKVLSDHTSKIIEY